MNEEEMRLCFALFAMLKMSWEKGEELEDAKDCWFIADKMLEARTLDEGGIVAIKKRRYVKKP
jgi:hypothetical protein